MTLAARLGTDHDPHRPVLQNGQLRFFAGGPGADLHVVAHPQTAQHASLGSCLTPLFEVIHAGAGDAAVQQAPVVT